jgi:hypothetical protein
MARLVTFRGLALRLRQAAGKTFKMRRSIRAIIRLCSTPALEAAGVEFIDENGGGPGVRLRKRQPKKA